MNNTRRTIGPIAESLALGLFLVFAELICFVAVSTLAIAGVDKAALTQAAPMAAYIVYIRVMIGQLPLELLLVTFAIWSTRNRSNSTLVFAVLCAAIFSAASSMLIATNRTDDIVALFSLSLSPLRFGYGWLLCYSTLAAAAVSIRVRPNNSFKPNPLRGSA